MKKAFIVGYYGYGNFGDEMLMEESLRVVKEMGFKEVSIIYPRKIPGMKTIDKYDLFSIVREISSADGVFFGGGGILQDETSLRSFVYYSIIAIIASLFRKRVVFLGNGFGPIRKRLSKLLMNLIASSKRMVFFPRDVVSRDYLSRKTKNVRSGSDLAIGFLSRMKEVPKNGKAIIVPRRKLPVSKLEEFLENLGYRTEVLVADPSDPMDFGSSPFLMGLPIEEVAGASLVISERFHPALVAAYFGVPFVAVGKKASRFFRKYIPDYPGILENPSDVDVMVAAQRVLKIDYDIRDELERDYEEMISSLKAVKF